jgi:Na+-transporting NADH:ubiquinone oxidoreductase subunit NqrD
MLPSLRLELTHERKFFASDSPTFSVDAPVNTLGYRRVMLVVSDINEVVARMRAHGAEIIGEMQYEDIFRLDYIRGPEGIIVGLSEQLDNQSGTDV